MTDPASGLSILHVIVRAGPTNSQFNEHCLPVADSRRVTVCSLFPAEVTPPPSIRLVEGDGTVGGCFRATRRALAVDDYDVVHVHAPASAMVVAATYLRLRRSRRDLVFTMHNSWPNFRPRNRWFLRLILAFFPVVVLCGGAVHQSLPGRLQRRHRRKLITVQNGVDLARVDAVLDGDTGRGRGGPGRGVPTVVSVNRLIPLKEPQTVIRAFGERRDSDDRLLMVGDGPLRRALERQVQSAGLQDRVEFTGIIPRDEVLRALWGADLFVSASRGEGLPVAMLEAMAAHCPVVVTDIPPHREVAALAPGIALVEVGDTRGLQRAMHRLLAMPENERNALGAQLRTCVEDHFSVRSMNDGYGRIYARVASRTTTHDLPPDAPLTTRLRRRAGVLAVATLLGGAAGYGFAEVQPPLYKGETTLMVGDEVGAMTDEEMLKASAALAVTYADLARREVVLAPVAERGFADSWRDLRDDVHTQTGDKNPQLVQVSAYARSEPDAAGLARAIASELVALARDGGTSPEQRFVALQLAGLREEILAQQAVLDDVTASLQQAEPGAASQLEVRADEVRASLAELQKSYAELDQLGGPEVAGLRVVDDAWTARSPLRPTPAALVVAGAALGFGLVTGWIHLFGRRRSDPDPDLDLSTELPTTGEIRPMRPEPWVGPAHVRNRPTTPREAHQR